MTNRISRVCSKSERLVVGLSSGTSADGVDAALVKVGGSDERPTAEILLHTTYPYPETLRERILSVSEGEGSVDDICQLNYRLGDVFAQACLRLLNASEFAPRDIDVVGSHGQTVCHLPPSLGGEDEVVSSTLQLGEAAVIAERTGAVVVHDFRSADIAAGGEGAPLAPCIDQLLFGGPVSRGFLNIGGIANLSVVPADSRWEDVVGFDTGPGNMVIDHVAKRLFSVDLDRDGRLSQDGEPAERFLEKVLERDFFRKPPPKSAGREVFGSVFSEEFIHHAQDENLKDEDILATACMLTARSVRRAYEEFAADRTEIEELYLSGGGAKNLTLLKSLRNLFAPVPVYTTERLGVSPDAKEALLFALLANQAIIGVESSLPQVTGATHRVVLGKIIP